jgi:hypothetical protein
MNRYVSSSGLYALPSVSEGVGRLLDFGATYQQYNSSASGDGADRAALARDWAIVGDDLRGAIKTYEEELSETGQ